MQLRITTLELPFSVLIHGTILNQFAFKIDFAYLLLVLQINIVLCNIHPCQRTDNWEWEAFMWPMFFSRFPTKLLHYSTNGGDYLLEVR